ncbi:sodium- and chloride-dependent creatine transporter 1-like [Mercenaria mercenaria]|uniref:sodium- and chloride-dependent creatine transporter 1-like n=1 Tax=Mercenaria mercenaria TaxID=6596 RepID=UPI00234F2CF0|nr:sodium- and chloride-dependent creatine transporter 1-like [Mercenaria mercenaria]
MIASTELEIRMKPKESDDLDESVLNNVQESSNPDVVDNDKFNLKRDQWSSKLDFILACVGCAVGLGNIWRFPYLCYKNGGGAFLIPYIICLVTCGLPLFMMELALGQYMRIGNVETWARLIPAFKGIGIASFVVTFQMNIYYIIILAWAAYFLVMSFTSTLPWSHCNNAWNTDWCFTQLNVTPVINVPSVLANESTQGKTVDAVIEFWERKVLHISGGIDEPGNIVWELAVSLLVIWILVYLCVCRGVRVSGKIVYFTALFPYVIITILLIRGVTLDGARDGIYFYLKPDFSRLLDPQVWVDGGTQIFFSYVLATGVVTTLSSYNKYRNNFYRDCFIIATFNSCTSFYGGFAVFSVLGFMAKEQNVTVSEVAKSGPGLVFIAYPKAITKMPISPLWAVLFFFMILLVGFDSQFVAVEALLAPIIDAFPQYLYRKRNRMILTAVYCVVTYFLGLSMLTEGGMYVFQLFDYYSASGLVLLWICFFEAVVVSWVFGEERFQEAAEMMIGRRFPCWFFMCWKYIIPVITSAIFIFSIVSFKPLTYEKTYIYPRWAQAIGFCMALVSMSCIPVVFIYTLITTRGTLRRRWQIIFTPLLQTHQISVKE